MHPPAAPPSKPDTGLSSTATPHSSRTNGPKGRPAPTASAAGPDPTSVTSIHIDHVTLIRRGLVLLDDCSLTVEPGEIVAIMGPSGAGKTTLLRAVAGLTATTAGTIERPTGRAAIVFQDPRLLPWRTALANVELVLSPGQRGSAKTLLRRVGLGDALGVYPAALSGGMRQRVAIARALACDAGAVLVDEPFASLDADTAQRLRELLTAELVSLGRPVLWVTHNPAEAAEVADRVLTMSGPPSGSWTCEPVEAHRAHDPSDPRAAHPTPHHEDPHRIPPNESRVEP